MRVAIVAECFLPEVNGVTNSVLRIIEHLERTGHQAMVIAPGCRARPLPFHTGKRVPAFALPLYRSLSVGIPTGRVLNLLEGFSPDMVHLAAPVVLGAAGARAARLLDVPSVAVYQTDLAGFARRYGAKAAAPALWRWLGWVHGQADLTLAPSTPAAWELRQHGVPRVACWARGVDLERFHPDHRSPLLRKRLAPHGEVLVGYVGRLAKEKQVHLLSHLRGISGTRVVVAGDGPTRAALEQNLPGVTFLGFLSGVALSQALAALDVFVHTGVDETFCQSIQEALASGVPVVAPASGGPMDLVQHGDNGWLYPAHKPELLRGAVEALVTDPTRRRAMAARARPSVERRTWDALGEELVGHYHAVTGAAAGRGSGGWPDHGRPTGRIAQVANFYGPQSGGLRTTVDMLGRGYVAAGFERVLVVPGERHRDEQTPAGRRITLKAPAVPGGGGYRFFPDWRPVAAVLSRVGIDRLEVSDKLTLAPLGPWATRRGIPALLLSHERLDAILAPRLPRWAAGTAALAGAADRCNRRLAAAFPTVVAASAFSCEEWERIGADHVIRVPLGVDLAAFRPVPRAQRSGPAQLVSVGRLSKEKRPDLALATLRELVDAGVAARLTMVGAGPESERLARTAEARHLPVEFPGHIQRPGPAGPAAGRGRCGAGPVPGRGLRAGRAGSPGVRHAGGDRRRWGGSRVAGHRVRRLGPGPAVGPGRGRRPRVDLAARMGPPGGPAPGRAVPLVDHGDGHVGRPPALDSDRGGAVRVIPGPAEPTVVRPLAAGDDAGVRRLFRDTICLGRPLPFAVPQWAAYESLCLDWYLHQGRADAGVLVDDGDITGYALVCTDAGGYQRWQRGQAAQFSYLAATELLTRRMAPDASKFLRLRLQDGWDLWRQGAVTPLAAHAHLNLAPGSRATQAGRQLADHVDRRCRAAGLPGWFGEMNAVVGHRTRALERLGATVVHRAPNHTLSWLLGQPVERLTVARPLPDPVRRAPSDAVTRAAVVA